MATYRGRVLARGGLIVFGLSFSIGSLHAQFSQPETVPLVAPEVPILWLAGASLGLGTAVLLVGGLTCALASSGCSGDQREYDNAILWGMVGLMAGSAVRGHVANKCRGSLPLCMVASGGVMLGGIGLTNLRDKDSGNPALLPIVQVTAAVLVERITGRRRSRPVLLALVPVGHHLGLYGGISP